MSRENTQFPKTKLQWLWENMKGARAVYVIGMIGTVVYNVLQLTVPYYSGKIVDLFLTGEHARENMQTNSNGRNHCGQDGDCLCGLHDL